MAPRFPDQVQPANIYPLILHFSESRSDGLNGYNNQYDNERDRRDVNQFYAPFPHRIMGPYPNHIDES